MYRKFDPASHVYHPRFGTTSTDIDGWRSFPNLNEVRRVLHCRWLRSLDATHVAHLQGLHYATLVRKEGRA